MKKRKKKNQPTLAPYERQRDDLGTQETIKRRALFVLDPKSSHERARFDPALTTVPLDVLWMWRKISAEEYAAAARLSSESKALFGKATLRASDLAAIPGSETGRDASLSVFRGAWGAILKCGAGALAECRRAIRDEAFPSLGAETDAENLRRWLRTRAYHALRSGLSALVTFYRAGEGAGAMRS